MRCVIRPEGREKISVELEGAARVENIRYPEALALLDAAYTNELRELSAQLRAYQCAAESGLVQARNALRRMSELIEDVERRHLGGG